MMVEESTRRLPNWMLGLSVTADSDKKKKSHSDDITDITDEPEEDKANLAKNSKFEAKRRKSHQVKDNKELNDDIGNDRLGRKRKAKGKAEIKAEYKEQEEKLTVEDLVSIAEEYVKAHENSRRKQSSGRERELRRQLPTTASSENDLEESVVVPDDKHISAGCETTSCSSTVNLVSEESLISTSRTGDPAHAMLDLFLGPLLKKPTEKEKRSEFIAKDVDSTYELKKNIHNDFGDEMVPPMKKKSSLKDKVSLLLD